jgi:hypothetical protein
MPGDSRTSGRRLALLFARCQARTLFGIPWRRQLPSHVLPVGLQAPLVRVHRLGRRCLSRYRRNRRDRLISLRGRGGSAYRNRRDVVAGAGAHKKNRGGTNGAEKYCLHKVWFTVCKTRFGNHPASGCMYNGCYSIRAHHSWIPSRAASYRARNSSRPANPIRIATCRCPGMAGSVDTLELSTRRITASHRRRKR